MAEKVASKKVATDPKKTAAGPKKAAPTHPSVADMVTSAIQSLNVRKGSSLRAIKKHLADTYKVDAEKMSPFIKKFLKSAVIDGKLVQSKGKGANGSFKLPSARASKELEKAHAADTSAKKPAAPKKSAELKAKAAPAKAAKKAGVAKATTKPKLTVLRKPKTAPELPVTPKKAPKPVAAKK